MESRKSSHYLKSTNKIIDKLERDLRSGQQKICTNKIFASQPQEFRTKKFILRSQRHKRFAQKKNQNDTNNYKSNNKSEKLNTKRLNLKISHALIN